jgi:hypothetical protein
MAKSVALYGFAPSTREGVWRSQADEVWSIVWAYKYEMPRLDRIIEIHPIWMQARSQKPEYVKAREHWEWLMQNTTIPVYMTEQRAEVPRCIEYPLPGVQSLVPQARRRSVFSSSFDFLIGLAVYEGYERIEVYGFEMGSDTEYRYQREGAAYWIGYCDAHKIELILPANTALLSKRLYGYEGGSMIYRQDLERMRTTRQQQKVEAFARLSNLEGQLRVTLSEKGAESQEYHELQRAWDSQYRLCLVISGALQECEYYLKEIDLEEPSVELTDPVGFIAMESTDGD